VNVRLLRNEPERTWLLVFEQGEPVVEGLISFARDHEVAGARLWGIGAFEEAEMGFYRTPTKEYDRFTFSEGLELLSLNGNLGVLDGEPRVHAHAVVGRADGSAAGGHLFEARVGPTLEVFVVDAGVALERALDERTGLPLIRP
jgi:uncharacterized protein